MPFGNQLILRYLPEGAQNSFTLFRELTKGHTKYRGAAMPRLFDVPAGSEYGLRMYRLKLLLLQSGRENPYNGNIPSSWEHSQQNILLLFVVYKLLFVLLGILTLVK